MKSLRPRGLAPLFTLILLAPVPSLAQKSDTAAVKTDPADLPDSSVANPVPATPSPSSLPVGTTLRVRLVDPLNSGFSHNGDAVRGILAGPIKTSGGRLLQTGTRVDGTVVSSAPAGEIQSAGVLSVQLTRVDNLPIISDVLDFNGQEGRKELADAAPAKGTEASVQAGAVLSFKVLENGHATGLDLAGAAKAKAEGTVGPGAPSTAPSTAPDRSPAKPSGNGPPTPAGSPNTQPGASQTAIPGTVTPH